jgi:hypothetical protein
MSNRSEKRHDLISLHTSPNGPWELEHGQGAQHWVGIPHTAFWRKENHGSFVLARHVSRKLDLGFDFLDQADFDPDRSIL